MALIDMTSNLKLLKYYQPNFNKLPNESVEKNLEARLDIRGTETDLKYSSDRYKNGYSGLPYIQTKIPNRPNSAGLLKPVIDPTTGGRLDYPIRGGQIAFEIGQQTYTNFSRLDRERISKFFKDQPRGDIFLQKQVGLQLTNPKIETGMLYGAFQNTRVYYPDGRNTLAQVLASGTGAHAIRHGGAPFNPIQKTYFATVNEQNILGSGAVASGLNRLVILNNLKMTSRINPVLNIQQARTAGMSLNMAKVGDLGISLNKNILFQYLGGPGSSYGIGATTISRVVDTTQLKSLTAMVYDQLIKKKSNRLSIGKKSASNISDFRNLINQTGAQLTSEQKQITGAPWKDTDKIDYKFFIRDNEHKYDKINSSLPFIFKNASDPWTLGENGRYKDLIKFVFEAVSNDNTDYSTAIFFRAFLTSGITDNNSATLNSFKYIGRGENFYTYQGFDRSISFSFRVAAESKKELKPMYNRLNTLVSQVYPDYSPSTNIMRSPLIRMTVGDYLYRTPGFLESVNIVANNEVPWEIKLDEWDTDLAQLPQVVDVTVSFKPILTELPRRSRIDFQETKQTSTNTSDQTTNYQSSTYNQVPKIIANTKEDFINTYMKSDVVVSGTRKATQQEIEAENSRVAADKAAAKKAKEDQEDIQRYIDIKSKNDMFGEQ